MKKHLDGAALISTVDDNTDPSKLCDVASDIQAHTNQQIIIDKYKSLLLMHANMVDLKRNYNQKIAELSARQENLCMIMSNNIQEISLTRGENELNIDYKMCVNYKRQNILEYNGNGFQLKTVELPIADLNELRRKQAPVADSEVVSRSSSERRLKEAIILNDIETIYRHFDVEISSLSRYHTEVQLKLKLMELHCSKIYQELLIIVQFEEPEKALLETLAAISSQLIRVEEDLKFNKSKLKCMIESPSTPETSMMKNFTELRRFLNATGTVWMPTFEHSRAIINS